MGRAPFWGPFWDSSTLIPSQRRLVLDARAALHARLSALDKNSKHYGMIHADLHPPNVLVNGDELHAIDFDDAGFGWYIYDLAAALVDYVSGPHHRVFHDALVAGYRAERNLEDEWLELLPMFYLVRALSALGWAHERPEVDVGDDMAELTEWIVRGIPKFL
jgi:Ser/Thr protein kinase RdoA (MazF antagonist)